MKARPRLGLTHAICLNMAMMVGIGPFNTIPDTFLSVGGMATLGLLCVGAIVAIADGMVWSELSAEFPGSGGTFHFYDACYGRSSFGRILKFLFVWQFLFSAPLELASGTMGVARYAGFFWGGLLENVATFRDSHGAVIWQFDRWQFLAMGITGMILALAYRNIETAGKLVVILCAGMIATVAWVILSGLLRFHPDIAFDPTPVEPMVGGMPRLGMGPGLALVMYCYLGYYQICYLGDEVEEPARVIPRSILVSVVAIAIVYLLLDLSILGVIPWREAQSSKHIASDLMERLHGHWAARLVTLMILWTGLAGAFAAMLSYSRVPYAAAKQGHFFRGLASIHPTGGFPHRSLLLVGVISMVACLAELKLVIDALIASRIVIQFMGQIATVLYLRSQPGWRDRMPYQMPLFPIPALIALAGWLFLLGSSGWMVLGYAVGSMALGIAVFLVWDRGSRPDEAVATSS